MPAVAASVIAVELPQPTGPELLSWTLPAGDWQTEPTTNMPAPAASASSIATATVAGSCSGRAPAYWRNPRPVYPGVARQNRWEGTTLLRVEVLKTGASGAIEIARSSGYQVLDDASVQTVRGWRFRPALEANQPVSSWVEVPIRFAMETN